MIMIDPFKTGRRSQGCVLCDGKTHEGVRKEYGHNIQYHECENCGYREDED